MPTYSKIYIIKDLPIWIGKGVGENECNILPNCERQSMNLKVPSMNLALRTGWCLIFEQISAVYSTLPKEVRNLSPNLLLQVYILFKMVVNRAVHSIPDLALNGFV